MIHQSVEPYYRRFWRRFFKDATPWARDNIVWGMIVLVVPPLAAYLRHTDSQIDWVLIRTSLWLYACAFSVYILAHLCRTPKKLDDERAITEQEFVRKIAEQEHEIDERNEQIRTLSEKPKRSAAEQYHFDRAKKALKRFGPKAVTALRYLRTQGSLIFTGPGGAGVSLPAGLSLQEALWAYNACAGEGLVTSTEKYGSGERTYAIPETMKSVLDELLYDESLLLG
ncbi:MAG: hypothetical protein ABSG40_07510 [Terriglobales bacterium]|jgi:hypothetical protein